MGGDYVFFFFRESGVGGVEWIEGSGWSGVEWVEWSGWSGVDGVEWVE
jgi:hypothetical protein